MQNVTYPMHVLRAADRLYPGRARTRKPSYHQLVGALMPLPDVLLLSVCDQPEANRIARMATAVQVAPVMAQVMGRSGLGRVAEVLGADTVEIAFQNLPQVSQGRQATLPHQSLDALVTLVQDRLQHFLKCWMTVLPEEVGRIYAVALNLEYAEAVAPSDKRFLETAVHWLAQPQLQMTTSARGPQ